MYNISRKNKHNDEIQRKDSVMDIIEENDPYAGVVDQANGQDNIIQLKNDPLPIPSIPPMVKPQSPQIIKPSQSQSIIRKSSDSDLSLAPPSTINEISEHDSSADSYLATGKNMCIYCIHSLYLFISIVYCI